MEMEEILKQTGPVMPVLVIDKLEDAVPLARALVASGITVLEVTLRTPAALDAVSAIAREVPEACVGVGTVTLPAHMEAAKKAGARFAVSPGICEALAGSALDADLPFLPGVATPSDIILAGTFGIHTLKFFPAEAAGGPAMLKALRGPFPHVRFCPTGGINEDNYRDYLELPSVICVGGSFITPGGLVKEQNWQKISELAAKFVKFPEEVPCP